MSAGSQFRFSVVAFDNYFTGVGTDSIGNMLYTLNTPQFTGGVAPSPVPAGGASILTVNAVPGGASASPSQSGLLLMYRDGRFGREADAIIVNTPDE
jgi:hypothetical protein